MLMRFYTKRSYGFLVEFEEKIKTNAFYSGVILIDVIPTF